MEHKESITEIFEKFTWKVENFSRLNVDKIYSEPFIFGGYPWRILLFPKGNDSAKGNSLSIYLDAMQTANMSKGWNIHVKFKLFVFSQVDTNMTITKEYDHVFTANENDWGYTSFIKLTELHDPKKGFIVNDACLVGAEVFVCNSTNEKQVNQAVKITTFLAVECNAGNLEVDVPLPEPESTNLEVYSPFSKVVCDEPTKQAVDAELVSAALGRVLYFLMTRKVKDMNEEACKELQVLWDELDKFKFDLTWLEPQVRSALGMKNFVEKTLQVENLKEKKVVLKLEMEKINAKLAAAELSLEVERDLLKAQGIKERDLESELGSGSWRP